MIKNKISIKDNIGLIYPYATIIFTYISLFVDIFDDIMCKCRSRLRVYDYRIQLIPGSAHSLDPSFLEIYTMQPGYSFIPSTRMGGRISRISVTETVGFVFFLVRHRSYRRLIIVMVML